MKRRILSWKGLWMFSLWVITACTGLHAQIGCPRVTASPDTTVCGATCYNLRASVVSGALTTNYSVQSIPYAPYPFNPSAGNNVLINIDDTWSNVINLPFSFCFYDSLYTQFLIGSNGIVTFDVSQAGLYCQWPISAPIPSNLNPTNSIMSLFQDIDPSVYGDIYWNVYGTAPCRVMVITWDSVAMFSCNNIFSTHQLVLYETTNIIENYVHVKTLCTQWNSGAAIMGMQDATGTNAVVIPGYNFPNTWTNNNQAWAFIPNGAPNYTLTWYENGVAIGNTPVLNVCPNVPTNYVAEVVYNTCGSGTITVYDTASAIISGANFSVPGNVVNVSCNGAANGSITALPRGVPPFTYAWSNGGGSNTITNLAPGTYTVSVTDACGYSGTGSFTVTQPSPLTVTLTGTDPSCFNGTNGSATANPAGGTAPYTYTWNNAQTGSTATGLAQGSYTVTVRDANGCTVTGSVQLNQPLQLVLNLVTTDESCNGNADGNANALASGGTPPYTWLWSNASTNSSIGNLTAGNYSVTIRDANNCMVTQNFTIGTRPKPVANAGPDRAFCASALQTQLDGSGGRGAAPYTYMWSCASSPCPISSLTVEDPVVNPVSTTMFYLVVTDSNGCVSSADTVRVTVWADPVARFTGPQTCFRDTTFFTDQSTVASGSVTGWDWDFGDGNSSTLQSPLHFYGAPGSYTITLRVTSNNGCTGSITLPVLVTPLQAMPVLHPDSVCQGYDAELKVTLPPGINAVWYHAEDTSRPFYIGLSYPTGPLNASQSFWVEGVDPYGCRTIPYFIEAYVYPAIQVTQSVSSRNVEIPYAVVEFHALPNAAPASLLWDFGDGSTSTDPDPVHQYTQPGRYDVTLTVIDSNGCVYVYSLERYIEVEENVFLWVPNAFSPNGDNVNDEFMIHTRLIRDLDIRIFDRWGKLMYESNALAFRWAGTDVSGQPVPEGVYTWALKGVTFMGNVVERKGTVMVVR